MKISLVGAILFFGLCSATPLRKREISHVSVQGSSGYHKKYLDTEYESSLIEKHYPGVYKNGLDGYVKDVDDIKYGSGRKKSNFYKDQKFRKPSMINFDELHKFHGHAQYKLNYSMTARLKREVDPLHEAKDIINKLSPERLEVYKQYFDDKRFPSEKEGIEWAIRMKLNDPDIFEILKLLRNHLLSEIKNKELKAFMEFYYNRIDMVESNSTEQFEDYVIDVRRKWALVGPEASAELESTYPGTKLFLERNAFTDAYYSLPMDRQQIYQRLSALTQKLSDENIFKMNVRVRANYPDIYKVMKIMYAEKVKKYDGPEEGREFLKYYNWRGEQMPSDSTESYVDFIKAVRPKWKKLSPEAKASLTKQIGDVGDTLDRAVAAENHLKAFKALSPKRQEVYGELLKNKPSMTTEEAVRWMVKTNLTDPDLYIVYKLLMIEIISQLENKELRQFMEYYYNAVDKIRDTSEKEINKYKKEVRSKWKNVSEEAKAELEREYSGSKMFLDNDPILESYELRNKLSADRLEVYNQYVANNSAATTKTEEDSVKWIFNLYVNDPDIYTVFRPILNSDAAKFKSKATGNFLYFYFDRIEQMKPTGDYDEEFKKFAKDVRAKFSKLNDDEKKEFSDMFAITGRFLNGN